MGTTADKLSKVQSTKAAIKQAIIDKGVEVPNDTVFADYPAKIGAIESGGGTAPSGGWQPQPDWWDIEALFKADPDPNVRMYMLITDSNNTITLTPDAVGGSGTYFKTSDGAAYNEASAVTHTWDISQDKPCSLGYKTRWVAVYKSTKNNTVLWSMHFDVKYVYGDNFASTSLAGNSGNSEVSSNKILEAIRFGDKVTGGSNTLVSYGFSYCYSLQSITIPVGTIIATAQRYAFFRCHALREITLNGTGVVSESMFEQCFNLEFVTLKGFINIISPSCFRECKSLIAVNIADGWVSPSFDISASKYLSVSGLVDMFTKLGANYTGSTRVITIGAANIAKLTPAQIAIATNKNYTIA